MTEAGGGGAFFAVGAGPTGIALVAADLSGGYISYDSGRSWQVRGVPHGIVFGTHACAVGFDPADERVLYLGTLGYLYRSEDRGATFHPLVAKDWNAARRTGTFTVVRDPAEIARLRASPPAHGKLYWTAVAFSPTQPQIGYAAAHSDYDSTDAIIFKTTDRGETWRPIKSFADETGGAALVFHEDKRVAKILVDPRNPETVYFLSQPDMFTQGRGRFRLNPQSNLRRSTDGGVTWRLLAGNTRVSQRAGRRSLPLYDDAGRQLIDPATGEAATIGASPSDEPALIRDVLDFAIDPSDPTVLYLTKGARGARTEVAGAGTYRSADSGATWTKVDDRFGALHVKAVGRSADLTVVRRFDINGWEGSALPKDRKFPQVWESLDGGRAWSQKADHTRFSFGPIDPHWYSSSSAYAKTVAVSAADPDHYYWVDSQWVYRSADGGASFRSATTDATLGADGDARYASTGVSNVVSLVLKVSEADPDLVLQANADIGLWRSLDRGRTWQHANEPGFLSDWVRYGGQAQTIALDPARPHVAWAGLGAGYVDQVLVKSTETGKLGSWRRSHAGLPQEKRKSTYQEGAALRGLSVDPNSPTEKRTLFVIADDQVARSRDDGETWEIVFDSSAGQPFNYNSLKGGNISPDRQGATAVDPADGRFVYAGTAHGLFHSARGGESGSWTRVGPPGLDRIQKIVVSRQHPERVYVAAFGHGLLRSADRGATWEKILDDRFLRGFAVHPTDDRIILAGSCNVYRSGGAPLSRGALLSTDDGKSWREVNDGLPWPFVRDVEFNARDPDQVFLVTPGTSFHVGRFRFAR
jgi:photosystem II stability/assembly factor-like uncharacterized protein